MSRAKNTVKSASIVDLPLEEKFSQMVYGEKCDPKAAEAISNLSYAIFYRDSDALSRSPFNYSPKLTAKSFAICRDKFFDYVVEEYLKGTPKHDCSCFRKLAEAMELGGREANQIHGCFMGLYREYRSMIGLDTHKKVCWMIQPMFTVSEMYRRLTQAGFSVSRKSVERMFRLYKIEAGKAKRGPKPGTKQKSVHRRLRN